MAIDIVVPTLGESVTEATIGKWYKKQGDSVKADEPLAELETDKVTLEVNAPASGVIAHIAVKEGESVAPGAVLGAISEGQAAAASPKPAPATAASQPKAAPAQATAAPQPPKAAPATPQPQATPAYASAAPQPAQARAANDEILAPSVRRLAEESGVDPASVSGTGKDGRGKIR